MAITILITSLILVLPVAYGQTIFQRTIPNSGLIKTDLQLGIYSEKNCILTLSNLDWGICEPGTNKTSTIYIRNQGAANTTFTIKASNWTPSAAPQYITITTNRENYTIAPAETATVTLTLTINQKININSFTFDIDIIYH